MLKTYSFEHEGMKIDIEYEDVDAYGIYGLNVIVNNSEGLLFYELDDDIKDEIVSRAHDILYEGGNEKELSF